MISEYPTRIPYTTVAVYHHSIENTHTISIICQGVAAPLYGSYTDRERAENAASLVVDAISALHDLDLTPATL